jgi:hypothetical protein
MSNQIVQFLLNTFLSIQNANIKCKHWTDGETIVLPCKISSSLRCYCWLPSYCDCCFGFAHFHGHPTIHLWLHRTQPIGHGTNMNKYGQIDTNKTSNFGNIQRHTANVLSSGLDCLNVDNISQHANCPTKRQ